MEKLLTMCCRLSREAWIVHTASAKGKVFAFKPPVTPVEKLTFSQKWFCRKFKAKVGKYVNGNYKYGIHGGQMSQRHSQTISECREFRDKCKFCFTHCELHTHFVMMDIRY